MATFKVKALLVSMGPVQINDVSLTRISADVLQLGSGDTFRIPTGTGITGTEARLIIPHATALAGTAFPASNGEIMVGKTHASTVVLMARLNGTTYAVEIAAV